MLEAKDTVMSDREILELHKSITDSGIYAECMENAESLAIHMTEHRVTAQKQAEITWDVAIKEGRREVVEWVTQNAGTFIAGQDIASVAGNEMDIATSYYPIIRFLDWKAKLKEWGLG